MIAGMAGRPFVAGLPMMSAGAGNPLRVDRASLLILAWAEAKDGARDACRKPEVLHY